MKIKLTSEQTKEIAKKCIEQSSKYGLPKGKKKKNGQKKKFPISKIIV